MIVSQSSIPLSDYQIGPEDLLQITLFNIPEAEAKVTPRAVSARVTQQGVITLPLLGEVEVKGLSVSLLEKRLRQGYEKYLHKPEIGVLVMEYRQRVSVIGAVQKPGPIELTGPKTVLDMLAFAGGLTDKAGSQVHLYRRTNEGHQNYIIDLLALVNGMGFINPESQQLVNLAVQAGDVINVPPAGMIFVHGAVKNPGQFPFSRRYSLTQVLATAGGVDYELADYSGIAIFRRRGGEEVRSIPANLNDILAGTAIDPQVEPDDVIVVPVSAAKFFVKRFVGVIFAPSFSPFMFYR